MVDVIGRAKVIISGDVDSRSIDQAGGKIGSSLKKGAVIGVAALGTLAVAGFKAFQSFEEAEAVSRKLTNTLDNMGKADAAPAVEKLASSLQRLTGIDDEVIKGGQTILALFPDVAESAGEVGGNFDRATRAALDMSRIFGSVDSASRAVGKALEAPEKAAALLKRANVFLNEEQQTLIDNFLAAGDAADAQDVILDALEDRYKGTAETAATESDKIAGATDEIKESIGGLISELLTGDDTNKSFSDSLLDVSESLDELSKSDAWQGLGKLLRSTGSAIESIADYIEDVGGNLKRTWKIWMEWADNVSDAIDKVIDKLNVLGDELDGNSGIDINVGENAEGNRSFNIEDLLADGGRNLTGGYYVVGDEGPEIMRVPGGSDVFSNSESREMVAAAGNTQNYYITGPVSLAELRQRAAWYDTYGTRFG